MKNIWRQHEIKELGEELKGKWIYLSSGFFDPLHAGHIKYLSGSKPPLSKDILLVVVNGDCAAIRKKGYVLLPIEHRLEVVAAIKYVDCVLEWNKDTVEEIIYTLKPINFCNGGDRSTVESLNQKEVKACQDINCDIMLGVGGNYKYGSSSDFVKKAINFKRENGEWENLKRLVLK